MNDWIDREHAWNTRTPTLREKPLDKDHPKVYDYISAYLSLSVNSVQAPVHS